MERPEAVLDEMEVLDEVVALPRPVTEELADLVSRRGVDLATLGRRPTAPATAPVRRYRARNVAGRGAGGRTRYGTRRMLPRHQEHPPDSAPRPAGPWLGGTVIVRGRSEIAIVLPPGWRLGYRRGRLRATFDQGRIRNRPRGPGGTAANLPLRSPRCNVGPHTSPTSRPGHRSGGPHTLPDPHPRRVRGRVGEELDKALAPVPSARRSATESRPARHEGRGLLGGIFR